MGGPAPPALTEVPARNHAGAPAAETRRRGRRPCHTFSISRHGGEKPQSPGNVALTSREGSRISRAKSPARAEIVFDREAANACGSCVQRRKSRETNLPAEQIGAQAPAWFSRAHGDQRRPQGGRGAAHARAQASQCVSGNACLSSSSGSGAAAIFEPRPRARALPVVHSWCRRGGAPRMGQSASASPCRGKSAMRWSATACGGACGRS
jgi:hypothetical protein